MVRVCGMAHGSSMDSVVLRACFGNWDAVILRNDGDRAILVRDEQRIAELALRFNSGGRFFSLVMSRWNPEYFSVRVGNVLYETGPIELEIGDEIQLTPAGRWNDEDGLSFRVEAVECVGKKADENLRGSPLEEDRERGVVPPQLSDVIAEDNAWRLFVKHRLTKMDEMFSMWLNLHPSPLSTGPVDHRTPM